MKSERNQYISYLKGIAILCVIGIHLLEWGNIDFGIWENYIRDFLYIGLAFFISLVGSVVMIAYSKYDIKKASIKLISRGIKLIGLYYLLNIIKLYIYDFSKEPFYWQYSEKGILNVFNILTLHSYTIPITILVLIGMLLIISPVVLRISKTKYPQIKIFGLILFFAILNYLLPHPDSTITNFLYAQGGTVAFSLNLWIVPYLVGALTAMMGFQKKKNFFLFIFGLITAIYMFILWKSGQTLFLHPYIYPLKIYYISASFFVMFIFVWIFQILEKSKNFLIKLGLSILKFLGDKTFIIYIMQWIIIDLTYLYFPKEVWIYPSCILGLIIYILINIKKILSEKNLKAL